MSAPVRLSPLQVPVLVLIHPRVSDTEFVLTFVEPRRYVTYSESVGIVTDWHVYECCSTLDSMVVSDSALVPSVTEFGVPSPTPICRVDAIQHRSLLATTVCTASSCKLQRSRVTSEQTYESKPMFF